MHPIITDNLPQIHDLCEKYKVKRLCVFGSVCTDRFNDESDIDLLYELDDIQPEEFFDYMEPLVLGMRELFGRKIDMVSEKSLSNPYFIKVMQRTRTPIYERQTE
ncbi:MAG: nucleotidyltransferase family protein [Thermoguttaceae bacterium]